MNIHFTYHFDYHFTYTNCVFGRRAIFTFGGNSYYKVEQQTSELSWIIIAGISLSIASHPEIPTSRDLAVLAAWSHQSMDWRTKWEPPISIGFTGWVTTNWDIGWPTSIGSIPLYVIGCNLRVLVATMAFLESSIIWGTITRIHWSSFPKRLQRISSNHFHWFQRKNISTPIVTQFRISVNCSKYSRVNPPVVGGIPTKKWMIIRH